MKIFSKILWYFVYALPAVLFFSYHPVISLGANESMNFELSLPLIWLVLFDFGAFILMLLLGRKYRHLPGISDRRFFLLALLPLYLTLSILWSDNRLRGLLTAGVMWLIFYAVFAMLYVLPLAGQPRRLRTHVLLVFFVASVLVCKFCYAQSIMDTLGVSRESSLLCLGCTYHSFGFPHPSGFAIEPQFMGNLLLAPTLTAIYLVVFRSRKTYQELTKEVDQAEQKIESQVLQNKIHLPTINWARWRNIGLIILAGFFSMTLFFTFSRGAIYAYIVALVVLFIFAVKRKTFRWSLITIPVMSFLLALALQGTFAAVGPTAETFVSGVAKSIHQLSLGIIDFRPQAAASVSPVENSDKSVEKVPKTTIFEGYVPESTNIRLSLNETAVKTWLNAANHGHIDLGCKTTTEGKVCDHYNALTPGTILFGVGLGGAGTAMHATFPDKVTSSKEIVQHEGFSLLLETGLVGIALVIFGLLVALFPNLFSRKFLDGKAARAEITPNPFLKHPALPLLASLIIAYLVTLNFFSGLPNALQIYLMPPLLYLIFDTHKT